MAEINYKKLLQVMGAAVLLAGGLALAGCASTPEHKGAQAAATGGEQKAAASGQSEASQGDQGGAGQSDAGSSQASGGGGESAKAAAKPAPAKAASEPKPDISATDATSIENEMQHFPRVLWHSHSNTYRFYVGTVLFAEYSPYDDSFTIMTDNGDRKNLVCKFAPGKGWQVEGKSKGETCKSLLQKMNDFLTHPYS